MDGFLRLVEIFDLKLPAELVVLLCRANLAEEKADGSSRGLPLLHAHDVVAGIDVQDFAGHSPRHVGQQEQRGVGDFTLIDVAS